MWIHAVAEAQMDGTSRAGDFPESFHDWGKLLVALSAQKAIMPHGVWLVNRIVMPERAETKAQAESLPAVNLTSHNASTSGFLGVDRSSPPDDFMNIDVAMSIVELLGLS